MANQEVKENLALPSVLELVSKLDSNRYTCSLKTEFGKISLEIVDKTEFLTHDFRERNRHYGTRNFDTRNFDSKYTHKKYEIRNFDYKPKRKSPSERGRDSNRLQVYASNKNSSGNKLTSDISCQTSLKTSEKHIQISPENRDTYSQTSSELETVDSHVPLCKTPIVNASEPPWFANCLDGVPMSICADDANASPAGSASSASSEESPSGLECRVCCDDPPGPNDFGTQFKRQLPPMENNTDPEGEFCFNCQIDVKWSDLKACGRCEDAQYCCRMCQLKHWRYHSKRCDTDLRIRYSSSSPCSSVLSGDEPL